MKRRILIAIPAALILVLALAMPAIADCPNGEPHPGNVAQINTNLDGFIETGIESQHVDLRCDEVEYDASKTLTNVDLTMEQTMTADLEIHNGDTTAIIDWAGEKLTLSQDYHDETFMASNTLVALPGEGTYIAEEHVHYNGHFTLEQELTYSGVLVTHDPVVINQGDVNAGVGLRVSGSFVGQEVVRIDTNDGCGPDYMEMTVEIQDLQGTVQTGFAVLPNPPMQFLHISDSQTYTGVIDTYSKLYYVDDTHTDPEGAPPFPWPPGWP